MHASSGPNIDLRFPGQWFQAESGLHQNWMRDYDPTTGRYIQADPLGLVDGASVYGYALQNPGRWTDRKGLEAWDWNGIGSTSVCSYYSEMAKKNPNCGYYEEALSICRGESTLVNALTNLAIMNSWHNNRSSKSQAEIFDRAREMLAYYDQQSRDTGQVDRCGCVMGEQIDLYHNLTFIDNGLSPWLYGGDLVPNWFPGNPVP